MIAQLSGTISHKEKNFFIVNTGALGYKVYVPKNLFAKSKENTRLLLWTHMAVREDAMELYGFSSKDDIDFFEMLLTVSGIGPRSALSILNLAPVKTLKTAVASGDATYLTKVSGIGKKSAAKIVLELKDKLGDIFEGDIPDDVRDGGDAILALKALGYSGSQAREALQKIGARQKKKGEQELGLNKIIKEALKILSEMPSGQ